MWAAIFYYFCCEFILLKPVIYCCVLFEVVTTFYVKGDCWDYPPRFGDWRSLLIVLAAWRRDHRWMILWCNSHYLSTWRCVSILKYMELLYNVVWRLLFGWCLKTDFPWMPWAFAGTLFCFRGNRERLEWGRCYASRLYSTHCFKPSTPLNVMKGYCWECPPCLGDWRSLLIM